MAHSIAATAKIPGDLATLVRQAQDGSPDAAQVIYGLCREPLLVVIRRVILAPLRRLYDSDDFLLDVFAEIFTRHFSDDVLQSPATLWPYLMRIAENKVRDAERKYLCSKRYNVLRDVPLEMLAEDEEPISRDLAPDEIAMLKELVEDRLVDLIEQLPGMLQTIVTMLLKGNQVMTIAHRLGVEPKRVYRAMEWLRKKIMDN